jgi:hypothetical protein
MILLSVRNEVKPKAMVRLEGLGILKFSSEFEPLTFLLVA